MEFTVFTTRYPWFCNWSLSIFLSLTFMTLVLQTFGLVNKYAVVQKKGWECSAAPCWLKKPFQKMKKKNISIHERNVIIALTFIPYPFKYEMSSYLSLLLLNYAFFPRPITIKGNYLVLMSFWKVANPSHIYLTQSVKHSVCKGFEIIIIFKLT